MKYRHPAWMILYGVALHTFWAVMLLCSAASLRAAPLAHLGTRVGRLPLALVFLLVAGSACWALWRGVDRVSQVAGVMPQQVALLSSAGSSLYTILSGKTSTGLSAPLGLLVTSQAPLLLAAVFHSVATYNLYRHA